MTQSPIQQQTIQLVASQIPKTEKLEEMLTPFALDETLIRHLTKEEDGPFVHFWTLEDIVILGMTDTKVPYLEQGLERLRAHGFTPIVRQAGGLAVVSNEGILNISLLFKNKQMPRLTKPTNGCNNSSKRLSQKQRSLVGFKLLKWQTPTAQETMT